MIAFACAVLYVSDGDTLRCQDGTRVRLAGIDAPEMAGHCRPGRVCTPGDPLASRAALSRLAAGRTLSCRSVGTSYNRVVAFCSAGGADLSCSMVRTRRAVARYANRERVCR